MNSYSRSLLCDFFMARGVKYEQQTESIDHLLQKVGTWFKIWGGNIEIMYLVYVHDIPEESDLKLGHLKGDYFLVYN